MVESMGLSLATRFRTAQIRNLDVYEVVHESGGVPAGGCERLGSTFGPYQSGAGHGATAVGECRTSA